MAGYEYYYDKLKTEYLGSSKWDELKKENNLALLIGAGVTSCIIGRWNELLDEIAILRCCSDHLETPGRAVVPDTLRSYIESLGGNSFLPSETDTVEKGEYLRYDPRDNKLFDSESAMDHWREVTFSHRVLLAMKRLEDRKRRDGAGRDFKLVEDFIQWCENAPDPVFKVGRKTVIKYDETKAALKKFTGAELATKLSSQYKEAIDLAGLEDIIRREADPFDGVRSVFGKLMDKSLEKEIRELLIKAKDPIENIRDQIDEMLRATAAHALWRPDYGTLETLLRLCLRGEIKEVLTYNFDMIFDRLLANEKVQEALGMTEKEKRNVCVYGLNSLQPVEGLDEFVETPNERTIRVYHVHGILDEKVCPLEPIVFSGTAYKSYQEAQFNCGNMYLASAYHNNSLLCVGFSGSDANFRHFTEQMMHLQGRKHRIYITRSLEEGTKPYHFDRNTPLEYLETAYACTDTYLRMVNNYFEREIHAEIVWAENYETMAEKLKELKPKKKLLPDT